MSRLIKNNSSYKPAIFMVWDTRDCYTCSFTEFFPFCSKRYYISNYKDFNFLAPAL
jgi:hypothetical protein